MKSQKLPWMAAALAALAGSVGCASPEYRQPPEHSVEQNIDYLSSPGTVLQFLDGLPSYLRDADSSESGLDVQKWGDKYIISLSGDSVPEQYDRIVVRITEDDDGTVVRGDIYPIIHITPSMLSSPGVHPFEEQGTEFYSLTVYKGKGHFKKHPALPHSTDILFFDSVRLTRRQVSKAMGSFETSLNRIKE